MGSFDVLIRGATLVIAESRRVADLGIRGETVAPIGGGAPLYRQTKSTPPAASCCRGGGDPHVRLNKGLDSKIPELAELAAAASPRAPTPAPVKDNDANAPPISPFPPILRITRHRVDDAPNER
jgi:hypothetical protein